MTPEQRQYAIGAVAVVSAIAVLAIMWFAFGGEPMSIRTTVYVLLIVAFGAALVAIGMQQGAH